eukprot:9494367-Pyramimonas_sp.AAC.1
MCYAACVDALVALHNCRRQGIPGTCQQRFEARLRVTSRRRRAVVSAWSKQAAVLFSPSSSSSRVQGA